MPLAPCGHPGEAIIGTFVLCRQCDCPKPAAPKAEVKLTVSKYGFQPYQVTRDELERYALQQYQMQMPDYATGKYLDDLMGLTGMGPNGYAPISRHPGETDAELRERLKRGPDSTIAQIACLVPGVNRVAVTNKGDYSGTLVRITRTTPSCENSRTIVSDVHAKLTNEGPVGHRYKVELATPGYLMTRCASEGHRLAYELLMLKGECLGDVRDKVRQHFVEAFEKYGYTKDELKTIEARVGASGFVVTMVVDGQRYGISIRV